ncbi:MAG: RNA 2',3'-cyclic phosphodiesterase [Ignavibacteriaceae bacterium]|nr:RNA 2',3'-cyclic phosphodiesterase [Ignavibacteriaceae bacterium]
MIRLFVALNIPEAIKEQIKQVRKNICPKDENFNWETNSKIHLTLKFVGEVDDKLLIPIIEELNFLSNFNELFCNTSNFGFFFKNHEPRILWIGLNIDKEIYSIVHELNERMIKFRVPKDERTFKPHLTLLRIKQRVTAEFVEKFKQAESGRIQFTAGEVSLFQSKLSPMGSTYKEIKKYYLKC